MHGWRKWLAIFGVLALAGLAVAVAFDSLVRGEVEARAARWGLSVRVGAVRLAWSEVILRDVSVALAGQPLTAEVREVRVGDWGKGDLLLRGGHMDASGDPRELAATVRTNGNVPVAGGREGSGRRLRVQDVSVTWRDRLEGPRAQVIARKIGVTVEAGAWSLGVGEADVEAEGYRAHVEDFEVAGTGSVGQGPFAKLRARAIHVDALATEGARAGTVATTDAPSDGLALERVRESITRGGEQLSLFLGGGTGLEVDRLEAALIVAGERLVVGPGRLAVNISDNVLRIALKPASDSDQAGGLEAHTLTFDTLIPIGPLTGMQDIVVEIRGGPVKLAALGAKEGNFGIMDVGQTELTFDAKASLSKDAKTATFDGAFRVKGLSINQSFLSDEPVKGLALAFRGKALAALDGSAFQVEGGRLDVGTVGLVLDGRVDKHPKGWRVEASFNLPIVPCQALLDSLPEGLIRKIVGMRLAGSFGISGSAKLDTADVDHNYHLGWTSTSSCRVVEVPGSIDVVQFGRPFRLRIPSSEGAITEIEVGPETASWTPLQAISPFMVAAVQTTEDGGFFRHKGFDEAAIRGAIKDNLRRGELYRGASTISMQVAKNLYLDRKKNLGRKLQEAFLTLYLEQALTKDQILELYLNIVELGPLVNGVAAGARHYFNTGPGQLALSQAFYLASILPSPQKQHFAAGGVATPGWTRYLQKLMKIAHARKRVSDEELAEGLREVVVYGSSRPNKIAGADDAGADSEDVSGEVPEPTESDE